MNTSSVNLSEFRQFAARLADAARLETLPRFRTGAAVFAKPAADFDPVTDADREAERVQRELIGSVYPEHGILGEEFDEKASDGAWRWVLDPIDGTRAFICGSPTWTTLIALEHNEAPVIGVIDQPFTDERWIGDGQTCLFRRGEVESEARCSSITDLKEARISTTDPRRSVYFSDSEAAAFDRISEASRVARFSMDGYAYGLLALGELDLVLETGLKRHDWAAHAPIVKSAGGVVSNWRGEPLGSDDRGEIVAAATAELHEQAIELIRAR